MLTPRVTMMQLLGYIRRGIHTVNTFRRKLAKRLAWIGRLWQRIATCCACCKCCRPRDTGDAQANKDGADDKAAPHDPLDVRFIACSECESLH